MKKNLLVATALVFALGANGQIAKNPHRIPNKKISAKNASTLFSQESNDITGMFASATMSNEGVCLADDFQLAENTKISQFTFQGFQMNMDLEDFCRGAMLYIYADSDGKPAGIPGISGTPVYARRFQFVSPEMSLQVLPNMDYQFTLNFSALPEPLILNANTKYWVVFSPVIDYQEEDFGTLETWFWAGSSDTHFSNSHMIDPYDVFVSVPDDEWTPITEVTYGDDAMDALVFSISGETATLGNGEVYNSQNRMTLSPNPASDFLNISKSEGTDVISEIYDMSGKLMMKAKGNSINISKLPKGNYIISIIGKDGKKSQSAKFIKK